MLNDNRRTTASNSSAKCWSTTTINSPLNVMDWFPFSRTAIELTLNMLTMWLLLPTVFEPYGRAYFIVAFSCFTGAFTLALFNLSQWLQAQGL
jgi:hypothetical protein